MIKSRGVLIICLVLVFLIGCSGISKHKEEIDKKDPSLCKQFDDYIDRDSCFFVLALHLGDGNLCNNLNNVNDIYPFNRDDCYSEVAKSTQNVSFCDKIIEKNSIISQEDCYSRAYYAKAMFERDGEGCFRINDKLMRNKCFFKLAEIEQNTKWCDKMDMKEYVGECYLRWK